MIRRGAWVVGVLLLAGCATQSGPSPTGLEHQREPMVIVEPTLEEVALAYTGTCVHGDRLSNNCAHFLSDAFIRAGFEELLSKKVAKDRCNAKDGRVIRAQDMLHWFQEKHTTFSDVRPEPGTGYWACYQEKPGHHHVMVYDADTGKYYGTDDCKNWPVQWFYQW